MAIEYLRVRTEAETHCRSGGAPSLSLLLEPVEPLDIDFADKSVAAKFSRWFTVCWETGNRLGWNFIVWNNNPYFWSDGVKQSDPGSPLLWTYVNHAGRVDFSMSTRRLFWKGNGRELGWDSVRGHHPVDLWPYALIEYPVSIFRLMGKILEQYAAGRAEREVVAGFYISGLKGWHLRPGSPQYCYDTYGRTGRRERGDPMPREPWLPGQQPKPFPRDVLKIDPEQLVFRVQDLIENPDRCALRLVRLIYAAFGFGDDDVPSEFDAKLGRLRLDCGGCHCKPRPYWHTAKSELRHGPRWCFLRPVDCPLDPYEIADKVANQRNVKRWNALPWWRKVITKQPNLYL
jgi:hypothetical protein